MFPSCEIFILLGCSSSVCEVVFLLVLLPMWFSLWEVVFLLNCPPMRFYSPAHVLSEKLDESKNKLKGRPPPTKKTTLEEELEEREPHRQMNYNLIG